MLFRIVAAIYTTIFFNVLVRAASSSSELERDEPTLVHEFRIEVESRTLDPDRRCCAVGRLAARKGYTCMVNLAIAERKLNMAHMTKMKFHVDEKADYDFSREMRACAKSDKRSAHFFRCCFKSEELIRESNKDEVE